mmetsp:Transcript_54392/g.69914  ORF Transcript_54392/g.69914 Transcript_54392/m.69914 type:complete len:332 (-) Transcript_54392:53-1048(-)
MSQLINEIFIVAVIVTHEKDFETLGETIDSLTKHSENRLDQIFVISAQDPGLDILSRGSTHDHSIVAQWINENEFPFQISDFEGCLPSPGWVFQQMLKLYSPSFILNRNSISQVCSGQPYYIIVDADIIWKQDVRFIEKDGRANISTYCIDDIPKSMRCCHDLHRYDDFVEAILPGLTKRRKMFETAVVHHTVLQVDLVEDLMERVQEASGQLFWERVRDLAVGGADGTTEPEQKLSVSEYELYFAFVWKYHPNRIQHRPLVFAIVQDWRARLHATNDTFSQAVYLVSHSHLRNDASLTQKDLAEREGVIGLKQAQADLSPAQQVALLMGF